MSSMVSPSKIYWQMTWINSRWRRFGSDPSAVETLWRRLNQACYRQERDQIQPIRLCWRLLQTRNHRHVRRRSSSSRVCIGYEDLRICCSYPLLHHSQYRRRAIKKRPPTIILAPFFLGSTEMGILTRWVDIAGEARVVYVAYAL